jgi:hypothetical protein
MRKLILIASFILVSAAAHAGETRGLIVASNDAAAGTEQSTTPTTQTTQTTQTAPTETAKPVKPVTPRAAVKPRETDEQKARRIAARYGISW